MKSPFDHTSKIITQTNRESGALSVWLVLATSVMLLAFVFALLIQAASDSEQPFLSSLTGRPASVPDVSPPAKELKLLAAEVVSRVAEAEHNSVESGNQPDASKLMDPDQQSTQLSDPASSSELRQHEPTPKVNSATAAPTPQSGSRAYRATEHPTPEAELGATQVAAQRPDEYEVGFVPSYPNHEQQYSVAMNRATGNEGESEKSQTPAQQRRLDAQLAEIRSLIRETSALKNRKIQDAAKSKLSAEVHRDLEGISAQIQFAPESNVVTDTMNSLLGDIADIVSRFDDAQIVVTVETANSSHSRQNIKLNQERGRAIIANLVSRGIDFSRFSLETTSDAPLIHTPEKMKTSDKTHVVRISALSL